MLLVEGLALAGRVDEAMLVGDRLITQMPPGVGSATARAAVHLKLARAAVDATRWAAARRQLAIAEDLLAAVPHPGLAAETATLNAEVAFAGNDIDQARALAESALASPQASPQIRCHALELHGRIVRGQDLDAARTAFEQALATADAAGLAVWRLRALHQLGTIDMFDAARTDRLSQARRIAGELGAASTGAVIDLQLTAVSMFRYELGEAEHHAQSAVAASTRLGLAKTHAIGLLFLAEIRALRRDHAGMDRFLALAHAAEPGDPEIEGSALAGAHGMLALLDDDPAAALDSLSRGVAILDTLPQQGPAPYRAMRPLLLAANGDPGAAAAIGSARRTGLTVNRVNRGFLGYADAILAGRAGDQHQAAELAVAADRELRHYPVWADLARLCAAGPALADGWGQPRQWLETAAEAFARHGIDPLALRCRRLLEQPATKPLVQARHHRPAGRRTAARGRGHLQQRDRRTPASLPPHRGETHRKPPPQDRCPVPDPASGNRRPGITRRHAPVTRPRMPRYPAALPPWSLTLPNVRLSGFVLGVTLVDDRRLAL